ncbi:helix-turn-helix domain-containing protein [Nonomuraea lactucae]|uniref:helix-turn-helix domain-containing protein n=1 Tax=Nonomuraea lactucae TaxID=2249762 RepID=UPI0013B3E213|nr:helix-turn-helix transcriptional regulator [Nonomuraea lactucae]
MYDEITLGARLRALRKWRRMSLAQLAGQAGMSTSYLSMAERGLRSLDRRSYIAALATALRVSETDIVGGPHLSSNVEQAAPHAVVPALRSALTSNDLDDPADDLARPLPDLAALVAGPLAASRDSGDYVRRGQLAADLLGELHAHVALADEAGRVHALALLIETCHAAGMTLRHLGYGDLAYLAAQRALEVARLLDDPVVSAQVAFTRALNMPKSTWDRPLIMASRAADRLQPNLTSKTAAQTYGQLHLSCALFAAVLHQHDRANAHLSEAREIATRVGEAPDAWGCFGPTNVGIWEVGIAIERGDYGRAVHVAATLEPDQLINRERRATFHADYGRALAHMRKMRDAQTQLALAERIAPQRIRNSGPVREVVGVIFRQGRAAAENRELRAMASRMGVVLD